MTQNQNRRGYEGYERTATDGRGDVLCESCGFTLKARGMTQHKKGVAHRQNRRIKTLLKTPCITQKEIAERVGVTTQRVQQIATRQMGVDGHERQRVCTLRRVATANATAATTNPYLVAITAACAREGLSLETVTYNKNHTSIIHLRRVAINGHFCRLARGYRTKGYIALRRPLGLTDEAFCLYILPGDQWVIVPRCALPAKQTLFAPQPKAHFGAHSMRHDWPGYIEAWHLLKREIAVNRSLVA